MKRTVFGFTAAALLATSSASALTINELRADQSGSDTDEFVEFYGTANQDVSGFTFIILQDNGVIDGLIDLTGNADSDGIFLVTEGALPSYGSVTGDQTATLNLENGENTSYILVTGNTATAGTDLDADDDGVFDSALPFTIVDAVSAVDDEDTILDGGPEDIDYSVALGATLVGPDGSFFPGGFFASPDGSDTFGILDFDPSGGGANPGTPGSLNIPEPSSLALLGLGGLLVARRRRG